MRGALWLISALLLGCGGARARPTTSGAPIGPRPLSELEALLGETGLSIRRSERFGFESEEEFAGFYATPSPHLGTTRQEKSRAAFAGEFSHHAWIEGPNAVIAGENTNHRGYPTVQFQKTAAGPLEGLVLIEFMVWLDIALERQANKEWFSFITVTSYADDAWPRTMLFNLDHDGIARLMHVPGQQQRELDVFQTSAVFPKRQWAKVSMLLDFTAGLLEVWVDEQLASAAHFNPRVDPRTADRSLWPPCLAGWNEQDLLEAEALCGLLYAGGVAQVHLGMYAPPLISSGDVYNDELYFYELGRP